MKTKIAGLIVIVMVMFTSTFATTIPGNVNRKVLTSFSEKFSDAREITWSYNENYVKASFTLNDQAMSAFFDESGDLMGVARNLLSTQLPMKLQTKLKKELNGGWITEMFEFATENETTYYATVENADQKIMLKTIGFNSWEAMKRKKKVTNKYEIRSTK